MGFAVSDRYQRPRPARPA